MASDAGELQDAFKKGLDRLLGDPAKKVLILQKLGLDELTKKNSEGTTDRANQQSSEALANLTPSGKSVGANWPQVPTPFWIAPYPGYFPANPATTGYGPVYAPPEFYPPGFQSGNRADKGLDEPGPSGATSARTSNYNEDTIDESEALELVEFDPSVYPKDSWEAPKSMTNFLEKHFNRSLSDSEREAIMKDFPKPNCEALAVPKLDQEVKEQLKRKGKDPHFGSEKSLYKIQEQLLDATGPLTCMWSDLLNKEAKVSSEDILLLLQRSLVLLGSASHAVSQERRKIAWSRINPQLKSLATEEYDKRESNLFGPGFLEKASKRLEAEKTLSKVSNQGRGGGPPPPKKPRFENDRNDLRSFLSRGAPARFGGRKVQRQQLFTSYTRFQSPRYHQWSKSTRTQTSSNFKPKANQ